VPKVSPLFPRGTVFGVFLVVVVVPVVFLVLDLLVALFLRFILFPFLCLLLILPPPGMTRDGPGCDPWA